jgi:hypothetical protein
MLILDIKLFEVILKNHDLRKIDVLKVPTSEESVTKPIAANKRKREELMDSSVGLVTSKTQSEIKGILLFIIRSYVVSCVWVSFARRRVI